MAQAALEISGWEASVHSLTPDIELKLAMQRHVNQVRYENQLALALLSRSLHNYAAVAVANVA